MTDITPLDIIILAAGKGSRMRSSLPKVLHPLAGRPMLSHIISTINTLLPRQLYIVVGHQAELIEQAFPDLQVQWILQETQQGTGHAVKQVLPSLPQEGYSLILYGDVPLITPATLTALIKHTPKNGISALTAIVDRPDGFGRIVRNAQGEFEDIIEEADTTPEQRLINEINAGVYVIANKLLHTLLPKLNNNNAQQEFYLPPLLTFAHAQEIAISTVLAADTEEIHGINDRQQLSQAERLLQKRMAIELTTAGTTLLDPNRLDIRGILTVEQDVTIDVNVITAGDVSIGSNTYIGPHTLLKNVRIGENVTIKSHCVLEDVIVGDGCVIGPFAHIRPGTILESHVKIGNFVELKKATIGAHSKINHLSYVGDAQVGEQVNIGAGTITCNYNGVKKQATYIGDYAFIGSNTALVAPVTVGAHAIIGAGSVITKDAPAEKLTLTRGEQRTIERWKKNKEQV